MESIERSHLITWLNLMSNLNIDYLEKLSDEELKKQYKLEWMTISEEIVDA
ncbi:BH0509 family protein [Bacillus licheniformis]|uniref:BH0509 family protein n=1 Tax=Bacillus licheniformis TaxID=1402 RepID=UPI0011A02077|nr:BH0509 family protein [Bacillus licheniformis]